MLARTTSDRKRVSAKNVVAGLTYSLWSALISLAVVPFYLKFLGIEAYGLVGLLATTQALLLLLDMGLAATVSREVARRSANGGALTVAPLVHSLACIYWGVSAFIAIVLIALAPWIAEHWVQSRGMSIGTVQSAVSAIGLVVAARWPIGLYQGVLIGSQRIVIASAVGIASVTLTSLISILILGWIAPTVMALFAWQALAGLLQTLVLRREAWRAIGLVGKVDFQVSEIKAVWRFSSGMGFISILGVILSQTDKLLLSKMMPLSEYGKFTLASVVAGSLYIIVAPLFNVLYPRFVEMLERNEIKKLEVTYHLATIFVASFLFPLAGFFAIFSRDVIELWTGNYTLAVDVAPLVTLLAAGSAFHGLMFVPHALLLAHGAVRIPIKINLLMVFVQIPILIMLTLKYGLAGAAFSWLILHLMYCAFGTLLTHRRFLRGHGVRWLLKDAGIPVLLTTASATFAHVLLTDASTRPLISVASGVLLLIATVTTSLLIRTLSRQQLANYWHAIVSARLTVLLNR